MEVKAQLGLLVALSRGCCLPHYPVFGKTYDRELEGLPGPKNRRLNEKTG